MLKVTDRTRKVADRPREVVDRAEKAEDKLNVVDRMYKVTVKGGESRG